MSQEEIIIGNDAMNSIIAVVKTSMTRWRVVMSGIMEGR